VKQHVFTIIARSAVPLR